ncbi:hypothetical protein WME76_11220 [Sorangium sp. So ce119]|uniref:hypothetical protein n=1 Tax=Sorangium sp. So ce119 TaxID=3133279 RepID=UPI003F60F7BC
MNVMLKVKTNATTNGAAMNTRPAMNTMNSAECVMARFAHRITAIVPTHASRAAACW